MRITLLAIFHLELILNILIYIPALTLILNAVFLISFIAVNKSIKFNMIV